MRWFDKKVSKSVSGIKHYLIGHSPKAKQQAASSKVVEYLGLITDRDKKMSIIKSLDVYFYETFQHEGASIAILEALASGVPVLCKPLGGCSELVISGCNGFMMEDRSGFHVRLKELASNPKRLKLMKFNTMQDFESRLHIRHAACKYMQLFEQIVKDQP